MALNAKNAKHAAQIIAGTTGRNLGHKFEEIIIDIINGIDWSIENIDNKLIDNILVGNPAIELIKYILNKEKITDIIVIKASWLGGLATSGLGHQVKDTKGNIITKSKSDIIIEIVSKDITKIIGISVKSCNNVKPTNAQLYFTTASAFSQFLRNNKILVSVDAENALKMFCGDVGFQPIDIMKTIKTRKSDTRRYFWEELPAKGKQEWEDIFSKKQNEISKLLLQKAYKDDAFAPNYVMHKTKKSTSFEETEVAIYSVDELIKLSKKYAGFELKPYFIRKGSFKNDKNEHLAPRFGIIQMQRGGQKQHPTQLQFNLQAGYFYKLATLV